MSVSRRLRATLRLAVRTSLLSAPSSRFSRQCRPADEEDGDRGFITRDLGSSVAIVVIGGVALFGALGGVCFCWRRGKSTKQKKKTGHIQLQGIDEDEDELAIGEQIQSDIIDG